MSALPRFPFEADFSAPPSPPDHAEAPVDEGTAREAAGYARGYDDGAASAMAGIEARLAEAIDRLGENLEGVVAAANERIAALEGEATRLALALARKFAARALLLDPLGGVEEAFISLIGDLQGEREVSLHLSPELVALAETRLGDLCRARLAPFRLRLMPDAALAAGDARIEWSLGGVVLDHAATDARFTGIVERFLPSPTDEAAS
ncbi:MAG TPA: FliH/SctL family protein [Beijerinckiaceae bacterium]|nr:FliH/SctL family protein [Beijerinckiaceae bacterium]